MGYVVDKDKRLKDAVAEIRSLTFAIDATTDATRIPKNLQEIEAIARRARKLIPLEEGE